jgi:hypothetical protein
MAVAHGGSKCMWINIEVTPMESATIYLPKEMIRPKWDNILVYFGTRSALAQVLPVEETSFDAGMNGTYESPVKIILSDKLSDILLICSVVKYQIKFGYYSITIGPAIGLLLGSHSYNYLYMKKYSDRLGTYEKIGGLIYSFSSVAVDWKDKSVYGLYYNPSNSNWEYGKFPIPSVIYMRNFNC